MQRPPLSYPYCHHSPDSTRWLSSADHRAPSGGAGLSSKEDSAPPAFHRHRDASLAFQLPQHQARRPSVSPAHDSQGPRFHDYLPVTSGTEVPDREHALREPSVGAVPQAESPSLFWVHARSDSASRCNSNRSSSLIVCETSKLTALRVRVAASAAQRGACASRAESGALWEARVFAASANMAAP